MSKKQKEHILFGRLGNKENEIKYFKEYLPLDAINIVEPFGGTFAIIRVVYKDDKYNKFVNDTDPAIYYIYTHPEEYSNFSIKMNNIALSCKENKHVNFKKFMEIINNDTTIDKDSICFKYWKDEKIIKRNMIKSLQKINHDEALKLYKKINFSCLRYMEILMQHKNDPTAFIFIDPPYMFSDNSRYAMQQCKSGTDITDILINIYEIFNDPNTKAKIMLVINSLKIIKWLFDGFIKKEYEKNYTISKRQEKILIICNY